EYYCWLFYSGVQLF
nr:immunoglobulin light chain junction region [Macaca mulatta]